jgi:hypothetical protein
MLHVALRRLLGMVAGMEVVTVGHVGVMRGLLVGSSLVVLRGFLVVTGGVLVVLGSLLMMLRSLVGHRAIPPQPSLYPPEREPQMTCR